MATTPSAPVVVANPKTPEEFFARARQLSDLEASGIPFHLKATYVASGDTEFKGNGTYEEWWKSKDEWRKEATLGDYKYVEIQSGDKHTAAATNAYIPLRVRQVMGLKIFHIAMPEEKKGNWELSRMLEGSVIDQVATLQKPCYRGQELLCTKQYHFAESGLLQSFRDDNVSEIYSNFQPLGKQMFPRNIVLTLLVDPLLAVDIVSLETLSGADSALIHTKIPADLTAVPSQRFEDVPAKDVTPPKVIHSAGLKYPESERIRHSEGMVVVACTIDATGAVREPYVQLSGGAAFDQAAVDAVRKYRFRPVMKNGEPGMANVNLVINFRIF